MSHKEFFESKIDMACMYNLKTTKLSIYLYLKISVSDFEFIP